MSTRETAVRVSTSSHLPIPLNVPTKRGPHASKVESEEVVLVDAELEVPELETSVLLLLGTNPNA